MIDIETFRENWPDSKDRVPGCLPRKTKLGETSPIFRDVFITIPQKEWANILSDPNRMRLRDSVPIILDQDAVGSCATESATQGLMTTRSFNGQEFTLLNPWFVYHTTSGGRDGGSSIDENLSFIRQHGIAPESIWPRSKGWRATPSDEAIEAAKGFRILEYYDVSNIEEFGTALFLGFPVCYGRSGHSILAVDIVDANTIDFVNSWGDWGDNGFGRESINLVNFAYGAWAIRVATDTPPNPYIITRQRFEPYPQL